MARVWGGKSGEGGLEMRCGKCAACIRVARVRKQALHALSWETGCNRTPTSTPIGEDVRLIWNTILKENPCEQQEQPQEQPQEL